MGSPICETPETSAGRARSTSGSRQAFGWPLVSGVRRLRGLGLLGFRRSLRCLVAHLPPPGASVAGACGGAGLYLRAGTAARSGRRRRFV